MIGYFEEYRVCLRLPDHGRTPAELRQANLDHFKRLLNRTTDAGERLKIERLAADERAKPDSAYPRRDPAVPQ